jgi:DNA-binding NarL/FixJ family response regulator
VTTQPVAVLVADDQPLLRAALSALISNIPGFTVLAEAADGSEAVAVARGITGDPCCEGVKVLILTTFDLDELVYAGLRAGASGFLLKDVPPEDLLAAIRVVAAGDALIAPSITRRLIAEFARMRPQPAAAASALEQITDREREVLALVARGLSNTEIAEALFISHATVKTYISRLLAKLGARDRAQLVMIAYETHLVTPGG